MSSRRAKHHSEREQTTPAQRRERAPFARKLYARYRALPAERRDVATAVLVAAAILLPWLGAVGLWDPWEVHYGEVARAMVDRGDYVYPFWEGSYFFSKPPLTMWMQALGIVATGGLAEGNGPLGIWIEWGMRMPFALLSLVAVGLVTLSIGRVFNRAAGLLAGLALASSPLWFMLSRQTVTDTPFVLLMTCGLACFIVAEFDPAVRGPLAPDGRAKSPRATVWWCWAYLFFALATLAKGLLGFMLPGLFLALYLLFTADWKLLRRARLVHGLVLLVVVALPWYLTLCLFDGVDDESKTFFERFFVHDHFRRLGEGVHTTTPGGSFDYFIEQLGFALFPWSALVPGALMMLAGLKPRDPEPRNRALFFLFLWATAAFFLFTFSATKFHHYCFPALPALAILCALFAEKLWREGLEGMALPLLLGIAFYGVMAQNYWLEPQRLVNLFVYMYDRAFPLRELNPRPLYSALFFGGGTAMGIAWLWRSRRALVASLTGTALAFALAVCVLQWPTLSFNWSQRDLFWAYYQQRGNENEPIGAYYLNWRGETFYSSNKVRQIKEEAKFKEFLATPSRVWFVIEQSRYQGLKTKLESNGRAPRIADRSTNKFFLVSAERTPESPEHRTPL